MKYIIDIPDDGQCRYRYSEDTKELKFPCPRLDPNSFMGLDIIISGATPYTDPDREAIENEGWSFAWKIFNMDMGEYEEMFDGKECPSDYREAKDRYEKWKKEKEEKEEIHVGDEIDIDGEITVVTMVNEYGKVLSVDCDGMTYYYHVESQLKKAKKTGRHFPEVTELLKKMRGELNHENKL